MDDNVYDHEYYVFVPLLPQQEEQYSLIFHSIKRKGRVKKIKKKSKKAIPIPSVIKYAFMDIRIKITVITIPSIITVYALHN